MFPGQPENEHYLLPQAKQRVPASRDVPQQVHEECEVDVAKARVGTQDTSARATQRHSHLRGDPAVHALHDLHQVYREQPVLLLPGQGTTNPVQEIYLASV